MWGEKQYSLSRRSAVTLFEDPTAKDAKDAKTPWFLIAFTYRFLPKTFAPFAFFAVRSSD